jgi:hypothetical protein
MFGQTLADFQLDPGRAWPRWPPLIDAAALLTYRAAWLRDVADARMRKPTPRAAAMAKMAATENGAAGDRPWRCRCYGGHGRGKRAPKWRSLYRDIRSLRIYEGATEVQQLIIGKSLLKTLPGQRAASQPMLPSPGKPEGFAMHDLCPDRPLRARPAAAAGQWPAGLRPARTATAGPGESGAGPVRRRRPAWAGRSAARRARPAAP